MITNCLTAEKRLTKSELIKTVQDTSQVKNEDLIEKGLNSLRSRNLVLRQNEIADSEDVSSDPNLPKISVLLKPKADQRFYLKKDFALDENAPEIAKTILSFGG